MKKLKCVSVNPEFTELFKAGKEYPIIGTAPNGKAWNIQRVRGETPTFVSKNSVFGVFEVVE
ncbi:hypothetical protein P7_078 [Pectobacterium phage vB_PcaM_P7_Pc]|nr:hypothetical protein P7_078 [Pectobacterium phage vB_PcaM_P7_Pc]